MQVDDYLGKSRLFRRLKNGLHGRLIERYATRLAEQGFSRRTIWQCLNVVGGLLSWAGMRRCKLVDIDEPIIERYLRYRAERQSFQPGDLAALRRWLSTLRDEGTIAPAALPPITPLDRICKDFEDYLRAECGLALSSIGSYLPTVRRFLREMCPTGSGDLGKINTESVIGYIERHARDGSPDTGLTMCRTVRTFLRYLHYRGLIPHKLAGCVPSIRRWKLTNLPTYLPVAQVQKVLDGCNRSTVTGRRDYAILTMLTKLGLRASEIATLTLDDVDWRAGEMFVCRKGGQRTQMPIPPDVGAAMVAYLRNGRPNSSCRRLFVRTRAPHVGFTSHHAITCIARAALDRAGITDCAHRGAHIFRHSLATQLLRSGATLTEIGQLLGHQSHDTTRIYAKVDIEALRTLTLPWPGGSR